MSDFIEVDAGLVSDFAAEVEEMLGELERNIAIIEPFAYPVTPFDMPEFTAFLREQNIPDLLDSLKAVNRTVHTVKGNSSFMGFTRLNRYCHTLEELTTGVFSGKIYLSTDAFQIIARCPSIVNRFLQTVTETLKDETVDIEDELTEIRNCREGLLLLLSGASLDLQKIAESDFGKLRSRGRSIKINVDLDQYDKIVQDFQSFAQETNTLLEARGMDSDTLHEIRQGMTEHLDRLVLASQSTIALSRYPRIVKDLGRSLGKNAIFRVNRSTARARPDVWDKCHNALVHMVRNAADHGIEMPKVRAAAGKPPTGVIEMDVYEDHKNIYIRLADDGKGIDPAAVAKSARDKGVATADQLAGMSDKEKQKLIFKAGFSTKEETTTVSGRGVGMDAVIEEIEVNLGGRIDLDSSSGKGTEVLLEIPKSETLSDCILFGDGDYTYALPSLPGISYLECQRERIHTLPGQMPVYTDDGPPFPVLDVMERLHPGSRRNGGLQTIIRIREGGAAYGLIVPTILGHRKLKIERKKGLRAVVLDNGVVFGYGLTDPVIVVLDPEHLKSLVFA